MLKHWIYHLLSVCGVLAGCLLFSYFLYTMKSAGDAAYIEKSKADASRLSVFAKRFSGSTVKDVQRNGYWLPVYLVVENVAGERACCLVESYPPVNNETFHVEDECCPIWLSGDIVIINFDGKKLVFERQEPDISPKEGKEAENEPS